MVQRQPEDGIEVEIMMGPEHHQLQQPINRPNPADTNQEHGGDVMDFINEIGVSDNEEDDLEEPLAEEPLAEEDYDPRLFEEQKERAQRYRRS